MALAVQLSLVESGLAALSAVLTVVGPDSIVFAVLLSLAESSVTELSSVRTVVGSDTIVFAL